MESQIRTRPDNNEATEAWNGPLYDRWVAFRDILVVGVTPHGDAAMGANPPQAGDRVVDIGCGLGDTTGRLGELVGPEGSAHGLDVAERMIDTARAEQLADNVSFEVADVQYEPIEGPYDYAFSRLGTMFFANPVAALRNVRSGLVPGATLNMVVWRQKPDNVWMYRAEQIAKQYLDEPEETDEPTCGPGPFSMAGGDVVSGVLVSSGFGDVTLRRSDLPITIGSDMQQAIDVSLAIGPAGEVLRLWGDRADEVRPEIESKLREAFADFVQPDGSLSSMSSTWLISARNPG